MANLILVDSDVLIDVLRKDLMAETVLTTLGSMNPLGISIVSKMETFVAAGILRRNSKRRNC